MQQVSSHDHGRSCAAQGPTGGGLSGAETGHTSWPQSDLLGSLDRTGPHPESIGSTESVKDGVQLGRPDGPGHLGV